MTIWSFRYGRHHALHVVDGCQLFQAYLQTLLYLHRWVRTQHVLTNLTSYTSGFIKFVHNVSYDANNYVIFLMTSLDAALTGPSTHIRIGRGLRESTTIERK